jgi:hypothetical protein
MKPMKILARTVFCGALAAALLGAAPAPAQDTARLDEALKKTVAFVYGQDAGPLNTVEQLVVAAVKDPVLREPVEKRVTGALATATTPDAKAFLCRMLFLIGSTQAVPTLEALLTDPASSHMARYVLGRLEGPGVDDALLRALPKATGKTQLGIVNTLAERRCAVALPGIAKLFASTDPLAAGVAAAALGRIGTVEAAKALDEARGSVPATARDAVDHARLECADRLLADGKAAEAAAIFESFYTPQQQKKQFKAAGLRGIVAAKGDGATEILVAVIKGDDPELQRLAVQLVRTAPAQATGLVKAVAGLLPSLSTEVQEILLCALTARGDATVAPAAVAAAASEAEGVRVAALEALGAVGDASALPVLLKAAAGKGGRDQDVARASLTRIGGAGVKAALLQAAVGDDAATRAEAFRALGAQAGPEDVKALVDLAVKPKDAADRPVAGLALAQALRRIGDPEKRAEPLLAALAAAPAEAKPSLVRLLARAGTPKALETVRAAAKDADAAMQDGAVAAMADWPTAEPADDLLQVAKTSPDAARKGAALKGFIRLAGLSAKPGDLFLRAMELASTPEDKKRILAGLGEARVVEALAVVEAGLKDPALQPEAALAAATLADKVRETDATKARALVQAALAASKDGNVKRAAQAVIDEMDKYEGYILAWLGSGPYKTDGKDGKTIFDVAYAPEEGDGKGAKWAPPAANSIGSWQITLDAALGGGDNIAGYMKTRVFAPAEMDAQLELGSDDAVKAWLNGKVVHANNCDRGCSPKQDIVKVRLQNGWNDLMLKIVNKSGGWAFCCRVRKTDGSAVEGMKVEAK